MGDLGVKLGNATTSESHEICSLAGRLVETLVAVLVGEARCSAGCGDATVIGYSGELLGQCCVSGCSGLGSVF